VNRIDETRLSIEAARRTAARCSPRAISLRASPLETRDVTSDSANTVHILLIRPEKGGRARKFFPCFFRNLQYNEALLFITQPHSTGRCHGEKSQSVPLRLLAERGRPARSRRPPSALLQDFPHHCACCRSLLRHPPRGGTSVISHSAPNMFVC
jgi:hypothetical protein